MSDGGSRLPVYTYSTARRRKWRFFARIVLGMLNIFFVLLLSSSDPTKLRTLIMIMSVPHHSTEEHFVLALRAVSCEHCCSQSCSEKGLESIYSIKQSAFSISSILESYMRGLVRRVLKTEKIKSLSNRFLSCLLMNYHFYHLVLLCWVLGVA